MTDNALRRSYDGNIQNNKMNKRGRTIMKNAHWGCIERLLSKHLQNIVPQFLTESIVCFGINR